MSTIQRIARKNLDTIRLLKRRRDFLAEAQIERRSDLMHLGSSYGGWTVATGLLDSSSICYLAGIGEDVTFDLHLIARFGCTVHAFDPVPRSQDYASTATASEPRFHVHPYGLWSSDTKLEFHAPEVDGHISHSATNLKDTSIAFEAPVRSVRSVMDELDHESIDLLKLSVEGAEYEILDHVIGEDVPVRMLCVEYAQPVPLGRVETSIARLRDAELILTDARILPWNWKLLFVAK